MNYNIKGTGVGITPELRGYVEKRLAPLDKFLSRDSTAHADVELQYEEVQGGGKYRAEFTVSAGPAVYRVEERGSSMHEAIDLSSNRLTNELSRTKKKRLQVLRHSAVKVKEFLRGWRNKI